MTTEHCKKCHCPTSNLTENRLCKGCEAIKQRKEPLIDWEAKYKEVHTDYQILIDEKNVYFDEAHRLLEENKQLKDLIINMLLKDEDDE